jgi:valine dehydrogenase (NAD+)
MSTSQPTSQSFDLLEAAAEHEQVVVCQDAASGLRAVVAIHSTALGPALGGTRFFPYATTQAALRDVLDLSRGMTYKAAVAGLDLGGGKAVIVGDPATLKSEALLRAYGRFVQTLGGRYRTACDIGTTSEDMDHVGRECDFVTGRTVAHGGAVLTAYGVLQGMRAAAEATWGSTSLEDRRVGVAGVGKVGRHLVGHLVEEGAVVVVTDVVDAAVRAVVAAHPGVRAVGSVEELLTAGLDVYAPCAMGGALDDRVVDVLGAQGTRVVCGAANNQLAHAGVDKHLVDAGVTYAPDYVVNAGGLIQVADELDPRGFSFERAQQRATGILDTTRRVLALAQADGVTPAVAADRVAEERIRSVGRLRGVWVPGRA